MDVQYQYDAFISYRHVEPDKTIAKNLHKQLETYSAPRNIAKRFGKKKISRIFRDQDELPICNDLSQAIHYALEASRYLIVICSNKTNESKWVRKEIETFSELHGHDKILALLVNGEPHESFPDEIRFYKDQDGTQTEIEPLAADIRAATCQASLQLLKSEKLRILAPLFGCTYDELKQRHRERRLKKIGLIAAGVTAFSLLFGSFTLWQNTLIRSANIEIQSQKSVIETQNENLLVQIDETKKQRDNALANQSRYLANLSGQQLRLGDVMMAKMLALEALPKDLQNPSRPYVPEAEVALRNACSYAQSMYYQPVTVFDSSSSVSFGPDGKSILEAIGNTIHIYDSSSMKKTTVLTLDPTESFESVCLNKSCDRLATVLSTQSVVVWDMENKSKLFSFGGSEDSIVSAEYSPDDRTILTNASYGHSAKIWDASSGKLKYELGDSEDARFSTDGKYLVSVSFFDRAVKVWNAIDGSLIRSFNYPGYQLFGASFSPDGKKIAVASTDAWWIMDAVTGEQETTKNMDCSDIVYSPDGKFVVTTSDKAQLWSLPNVDLVQEFTGNRVVFSPNNNDILESAHLTLPVVLWEKSGAINVTGRWNFDSFYRTTYNDKWIAAVDKNELDAVTVISLKDKSSVVFDGFKKNIVSIDLSPDGEMIAASSFDGSLVIWDIKTKSKVAGFTSPLGTWFIDIKFNADSKKILAATTGNPSKKSILSFDLSSGKQETAFNLATDEGMVYKLNISNDGNKVSTILYNETGLQIRDIHSGKILRTMGGNIKLDNAVFSPNGEYLLASDINTVYLWKTDSGDLIYKTEKATWAILDIDFSPDSSKILIAKSGGTSNLDKVASVIAIPSGTVLWEISGDPDIQDSVLFSADGSQIVIMMGSSMIAAYDYLSYDNLIEAAVGSLHGRQLTDDEKNRFFMK